MIKKVNGISLNVETYGDGAPIMLLHGFTGSLQTWKPFVSELISRCQVVLIDLVGHGFSDSPPDPARYSMGRVANDIASLLDALSIEKTSVLGYSMGGRLALHFALTYPERTKSLVLESASPGLASADEREARIKSDNELADFIEKYGVPAFVKRWENLSLFESQRRLPDELWERLHTDRLRNSSRGLASSLRGMGTGKQASLWESLSALNAPTLILAGELDLKFREIGLTMAQRAPNTTFKIIKGAGHTIHLEQPERFIEEVSRHIFIHGARF
jgi:2-succinyl-6-hydroxy-2,4-cyclohexadiene-1-carboxylate synthase